MFKFSIGIVALITGMDVFLMGHPVSVSFLAHHFKVEAILSPISWVRKLILGEKGKNLLQVTQLEDCQAYCPTSSLHREAFLCNGLHHFTIL